MRGACVEGARGERQRLRSLGGEARRVVRAIESREKRGAHRVEIVARWNGHEVLPANRFASRLDAALVVSRAGAAERRFEEIVRRKRLEARGELALGADEDLLHRRFDIVVRDALRDASEVREGAHMAVENGSTGTDIASSSFDCRRIRPSSMASRASGRRRSERPLTIASIAPYSNATPTHVDVRDLQGLAGR
jgi:hypothetical protein